MVGLHWFLGALWIVTAACADPSTVSTSHDDDGIGTPLLEEPCVLGESFSSTGVSPCTPCNVTCDGYSGYNAPGGQPCGLTHDIVCAVCPPGQYHTDPGTCTDCGAWSAPSCPAGTGINAANGGNCDASNPMRCTPCDSGTFNDGKSRFCQLCSVSLGKRPCPPGMGLNWPDAHVCNATHDDVCAPCTAGNFQRGDGALCQRCSFLPCGWGEGYNGVNGSACAPDSDTRCGACGASQFRANDNFCRDCTKSCGVGMGVVTLFCGVGRAEFGCEPCPAGTFNSLDDSTDACQQCSACPTGFGFDAPGGSLCDATHDGVCAPCGPGYYQPLPNTCARCVQGSAVTCPAGTGGNGAGGTPCDGSTYLTCGPCPTRSFNDGSSGACASCLTSYRSCPVGTGVDAPLGGMVCNATHDDVCAPCPAGFFQRGSANPGFSLCSPCRVQCSAGNGWNGQRGSACQPSSDTVCGPCLAGMFYNGASRDSTCRDCLQCTPGTAVQTPCDGRTNTQCVCSPTCPPGTGTNRPGATQCNATSDRTCVACAPGTYNDGMQTLCFACPAGAHCGAGTGINAPGGTACNATSSRVCARCASGTYNDGSFYLCAPCTPTCVAGTGLNGQGAQACTPRSDRVCASCPTSTWNNGSFSLCQACSLCHSYPLSLCTASSDAVCPAGDGAHCTSLCGAGTGVNAPGGVPCTTDADHVCAPCALGTFNYGGSQFCQGCSLCGAAAYMAAPCTATTDTQCLLCSTQCPLGQGTNAPGGSVCTATANRVCAPCAPGSYMSNYWMSTCSPCSTTCPLGTGNGGSACTASADRSCGVGYCLSGTWNNGSFIGCQSCSSCLHGTYVVSACSYSHDTVCSVPCTSTCAAGTGTNGIGGMACTATQDRVCAACPANTYNDGSNSRCLSCCGTNQYANGVCHPHGPAPQCIYCSTQCRSGQGTNGFNGAACTPTTDRVCGSCFTSSWNDGTNLRCQDCSTCLYGQYTVQSCGGAVDTTCRWCSSFCSVGHGVNGLGGSGCGQFHDITCGACASGYFQTGTMLYCSVCQSYCPQGMGMLQPCTQSADMTCGTCPTGSFNSGFYNRECTDCKGMCPAHTGVIGYGNSCTSTSDAQCSTCQSNTDNDGTDLYCTQNQDNSSPKNWGMIIIVAVAAGLLLLLLALALRICVVRRRRRALLQQQAAMVGPRSPLLMNEMRQPMLNDAERELAEILAQVEAAVAREGAAGVVQEEEGPEGQPNGAGQAVEDDDLGAGIGSPASPGVGQPLLEEKKDENDPLGEHEPGMTWESDEGTIG